jgi:hypothetical protein
MIVLLSSQKFIWIPCWFIEDRDLKIEKWQGFHYFHEFIRRFESYYREMDTHTHTHGHYDAKAYMFL